MSNATRLRQIADEIEALPGSAGRFAPVDHNRCGKLVAEAIARGAFCTADWAEFRNKVCDVQNKNQTDWQWNVCALAVMHLTPDLARESALGLENSLAPACGRIAEAIRAEADRLDRQAERDQPAAAGEGALSPESSESALSASSAEYDFFICHATEDKDAFVTPLAAALQERRARVWFDAYTLKVGDSLRRSIDRGLAKSRFGIVVLSLAFFQKNWPKYELDGLVAGEMAGVKVILPIWHGVSKDDVCGFSPTLADRVALDTSSLSVAQIADELCGVLRGDAEPV